VNVAWGSDASAAAVPVTIKGAGSWGPNWEMKSWQDALFGADQPIDMKYTAHGSVLGRQDFLDGNADFVISGRPFTSEELAKLPNGGKDIIDAPVR
jgi:ABC-type phosphate transport system substrate-binding protein